MAEYLGNNILPARAGKLVHAAYVSKENDVAAPFALATGWVERVIDLIALVILGSVSLAMAGILSPAVENALKATSAIAVVGIVGLLVMPYVGGKFDRILLVLPILGESAKVKLGRLLEQFLRGIGALHDRKRAGVFTMLTCLIWLIDGIGVIILAHALHIPFKLSQSFLLLAGLALSSSIPSTPSYMGIYQFVAVILLQPFGISNTSAIAFIIFFQVVIVFIVASWGSLAIWPTSSFSKS